MRIRNIKIKKWRNFENIEFQLNIDSGLVCVVGANGTGKSHLLELIAACAHELGLSQGIDIPRGNPFSDLHDFSLTFQLAEGVSEAIDVGLRGKEVFPDWDRTLTIESRNPQNKKEKIIIAGGIKERDLGIQFAEWVINNLKQSKEVHFLSLDADRAYPKKEVNISEVAQAFDTDWFGVEYTRGRSFKTTTTLYDEWIKYFLAQENQSGTNLMQGMRKAKKLGIDPPKFEDHFEEYASSLKKVLPHLEFTGVDLKKRTLRFDTTGLVLSFNQLSGGERELAFLVGQIDRFGLRNGLFLLDEPELHLNSDLIRTWVSYLTGTVSTGQIWLATHSLEAVEAAGQEATFVLERNEETRKVDRISRLDERPVHSALSRAVGTPAFSISQLLFIFIEGEEGVGERERFRKLTGLPHNVRFLECGSCNEVLRRVEAIKALAKEAEAGIRIGGIIDRDFRSDPEVNALSQENNIFVLPVHEAENFFLNPDTLLILLKQHGLDGINPTDLIRDAADKRAGSWIFQYGMASRNAQELRYPGLKAKYQAKQLDWSNIENDQTAAIASVVEVSDYTPEERQKFQRILEISVSAYKRKRGEAEFWKVCEGKQILNDIANSIGFAGAPALVIASFALWERETSKIPRELIAVREYLNSL